MLKKDLIKFTSLSAPTKIEKLTAGSDEKNTAQTCRTDILTYPTITVILQIFGVVLFSIFSVVIGFTEIKKTPK